MSEILAIRLGSIIPIENLPQQKIFFKSYKQSRLQGEKCFCWVTTMTRVDVGFYSLCNIKNSMLPNRIGRSHWIQELFKNLETFQELFKDLQSQLFHWLLFKDLQKQFSLTSRIWKVFKDFSRNCKVFKNCIILCYKTKQNKTSSSVSSA